MFLIFYIIKKCINIKINTIMSINIKKEIENIKDKLENNLKLENKIIITQSINQTKNWRKSQEWYKNGKSNECELYQIKLLKHICGNDKIKINKGFRINLETYELEKCMRPFCKDNGFEYTEDIDVIYKNNNKELYINLKMICDKGGSQTRTLREVYHFIKAQIQYISTHNNNITFINILDGDTSYSQINKFNYLLNKSNIDKSRLFIGDMYKFNNYFQNIK